VTTLLLADHDGRALSDATARALTAAQAIGEPVDVLVAGENCTAAASDAARLEGVRQVLLADSAALAHGLAEPLTALLTGLAAEYATLAAPATGTGKTVMPRVAALLDVAQISEITAVVDAATFERPVYAGNAIETVRTGDPRRVLTVRASAFAPTISGDGEAPVVAVAVPEVATRSAFVSAEVSRSDRPDLTAAAIVISGGRAFGSAEAFRRYLEPLAAKLNAAIGASRAAVDAGYAPNELQVGQTGKVVAPDLYIAVGISGAIQHLAGMKGSRLIVAINKDPEAPIFAVADYGLVGDLTEVLPELERAL
jgi:electron transfer flavoprotein alpha subunit